MPPQVPHLGTSPTATGEELGGGDLVVDFGDGDELDGGDLVKTCDGLGGGTTGRGRQAQRAELILDEARVPI